MFKPYKKAMALIRLEPSLLLTQTDKSILNYADSLIPYSIGMEIETKVKEEYRHSYRQELSKIPYIMEYNESDITEIRVRIPNGIKGLICLYELSKVLHRVFYFNEESGIHYHIDFTDVLIKTNSSTYKYITYLDYKNSDLTKYNWVLKALEHWHYKGNFNLKEVSFNKRWVKFHTEYNTVEVRIGEMTFDYSLLLKRIINLGRIAKKLKSQMRKEIKEIENKI